MASVDQSKVKSGFDVEVLLGEHYLQMLLQTAFDAGMIPASAQFSTTTVRMVMLGAGRLYEPEPDSDGALPPTNPEAFKTEILFNHALGANVKVRMIVQPDGSFPIPFDLFIQLDVTKEFEEGSVSKLGLVIHVVDIESIALATLEQPPFNMPKAEVLAKVQSFVDRTIDMGGTSKFKRVEDVFTRWHEGDANHPNALGLYLNVRLRNGDDDDQFVAARGDLNEALNLLPQGEDIAVASRPGLYSDMSKDVFSRTAIKNLAGIFEHALRYNILNPKSTRIGNVNSIRVGRIPPIFSGTPSVPVPQNGLRITLEGEYVDPIDLTNTDLTFTIDIRPSINGDGILVWNTDLDVDIDALFEFITFWAFTLVSIAFGPVGAAIFLGVVIVGEVGAGIFFGEYYEARATKRADATLSDVIPDRLTVKTRRWDPFYATLHQVVTKPSQAVFNDKGFLMCGKAFVGRELVPPVDTVIRDETRDADGAITGLRYRFADFEKIQEDVVLHAPGTSRRGFTLADTTDPELFGLSLDQIQERIDDPEGPLIVTKIPYFPAAVYIREHQIDQLMCISSTELGEVRDALRTQATEREYVEIKTVDGDAILQEVTADLSANGGTPTQQEIDDEVERRIQERLKAVMDKYESPTPLDMARLGLLEPFLRFDVTPEELVMLQDKGLILIDSSLDAIEPRHMSKYVRDKADAPGPGADADNLLKRPRYRPSANGPIFR